MKALEITAIFAVILAGGTAVISETDANKIVSESAAVAAAYEKKVWDNCDAVAAAAASFSDFQCVDQYGNSRPDHSRFEDSLPTITE
jgi:hypothetical protein